MTTTFALAPAPAGIGFSTLLRVELRKATDTRSGRALLGLIVGLTVVVLGWAVTQHQHDVAFEQFGRVMVAVVAFLAPILGLLAMTAEWTQRTALTTFTLAPRRGQVLAAKFIAAMILAMATLAAGIVLSFVATAIGGGLHGGADWSSVGTELRAYAVIVATQVIMAAAFGALAQQTAIGIGVFLAAPVVWASASTALLGSAAPWFDVFSAYDHLASSQPLDHLPQTLTAVTLWVLLPAALGMTRCLRREVK